MHTQHSGKSGNTAKYFYNHAIVAGFFAAGLNITTNLPARHSVVESSDLRHTASTQSSQESD